MCLNLACRHFVATCGKAIKVFNLIQITRSVPLSVEAVRHALPTFAFPSGHLLGTNPAHRC